MTSLLTHGLAREEGGRKVPQSIAASAATHDGCGHSDSEIRQAARREGGRGGRGWGRQLVREGGLARSSLSEYHIARNGVTVIDPVHQGYVAVQIKCR